MNRLPPGANGARRDYLDAAVPGLLLRVSSERRVYFIRYRAPGRKERVRRRLRLGDARVIDLEKARRRARNVMARVDKGRDPVLERRAKKLRTTTVTQLAERWVQAHSKTWRPATLLGWQRFLDKEILPKIGNHSPAAVTREDILAIIDRIKHGVPDRKTKGWKRKPAPVSAARCYEALRRLFRWAESRGVVEKSPCVGIETPAKAKKGTRTYTNEELRRIAAAVGGTQLEHLVPLIAHCATRSEETRSAQWTDIDIERKLWRIPPERSKTGKRTGNAHDVPLSAGALGVLASIKEANFKAGLSASPYLFPAASDRTGPGLGRDTTESRKAQRLNSYMAKPNRATAKLKAAGVDLRLHDLRRTVATRLSEHGVPVHVIEHVLGHALPALIRTYQLHVPMAEMREALDWWSGELRRILDGRGPDAVHETVSIHSGG